MNTIQFYKLLADPTRLKSLLLIKTFEELCVCELMVGLEESQPKISRHLAQLRQAGILIDRRQGQWVYYRIDPDLPQWCQQVLALTADADHSMIAAEKLRINQSNSGSTVSRCS